MSHMYFYIYDCFDISHSVTYLHHKSKVPLENKPENKNTNNCIPNMKICLTSEHIVNEKLSFKLPQDYLDLTEKYKIRIITCYIKWKKPPGEHLFVLRSNMVPRSSANLTQDVLCISTISGQQSVHVSPAQIISYKTQIYDTENIEFYLHSYTSEEKEDIDFIYLQFEIAENGWF